MNIFKKLAPKNIIKNSHIDKMIADGAKMTKCGWCGGETPVWQPMDLFGFSGTHCQYCHRPVDEYYRDWIFRAEWSCGCVYAEFASGSNYQSYPQGTYHSSRTHIGEAAQTIFKRSKEEAIANSVRVIMYPDRGGYTGIAISPNEARMYAFGSWLKEIKFPKDIDEVFNNWKPWMDELLENYRVWYENPEHRGCHIDDVVTKSMRDKLPSLMGRTI